MEMGQSGLVRNAATLSDTPSIRLTFIADNVI
jgi:hypothetical protein